MGETDTVAHSTEELRNNNSIQYHHASL